MKFRLIHYFDVWGNRKDGYEVNNLCEDAIVNFDSEYPTESEILKKLKEIDFFKKTVRLRSIRFDHNCGEMIEIEDRDGMPICRLETLKYEMEKRPDDDFLAYHKEYSGIHIKTVYDEEDAQ
jgi:hypothetical protein